MQYFYTVYLFIYLFSPDKTFMEDSVDSSHTGLLWALMFSLPCISKRQFCLHHLSNLSPIRVLSQILLPGKLFLPTLQNHVTFSQLTTITNEKPVYFRMDSCPIIFKCSAGELILSQQSDYMLEVA